METKTVMASLGKATRQVESLNQEIQDYLEKVEECRATILQIRSKFAPFSTLITSATLSSGTETEDSQSPTGKHGD